MKESRPKWLTGAGRMRLVCPNCDAEYEVDAALIPDSGRDVQCSNCGHAWFQASPTVQAESSAEAALFASAARADEVEDDPPYDAAPGFAAAPSRAAAAPPMTRNIDASVLAVLREEAERESLARKAEGNSLETQDELGLVGTAPGGATPNDRIARMKNDAESGPSASVSPRSASAKSEMLPEIDAINSTLRAKTERRTGDQAAIAETMASDAKSAGGFRRGFLLSMTVIILALALYLATPFLIEKIPAAASPLRAYVSYVDGLRAVLDRLLQMLIAQISALTDGAR